MGSIPLLKTVLPMLVMVVQVVHAWEPIKPFYEWNTTFNSSAQFANVIPWKDTFIRLAHTYTVKNETCEQMSTGNFYLYIDTVDSSYEHPVHCEILTNAVSYEIGSAVTLDNGKVVVQLSGEVFIVDLTSCTIVNSFKILSDGIIPDSSNFDVLIRDYYYLYYCKNMCVFKYNNQGQRVREFKEFPKIKSLNKIKISQNRSRIYYGLYNEGSVSASSVPEGVVFFDSNYTVVEDHPFVNFPYRSSFSFEHGNITTCYQINKVIECKLMDSKFNVNANASFNVQNMSTIYKIDVYNLLGGGAVVFYGYYDFEYNNLQSYRHINADGKSNEENGYLFTPGMFAREYFSSFSYEKDMIEGIYCTIIAQRSLSIGKCIKANQDSYRTQSNSTLPWNSQ